MIVHRNSQQQQDKTKKPQPLEAAFRFKNLNADAADTLINRFTSLTALDLSNNRLDTFPKCVPSTIVAIDLSYNIYLEVPTSKRLDNLVELRLRGNHIKRMSSLACFPNLKFLDLSYNSISRVEGLETLTQLQHLNLEANAISAHLAIRSLSVNKQLTTLILVGNPISASAQYKLVLLNTIPSLVILDGQMLAQRKKLAVAAYKNGYVELFDASKYRGHESSAGAQDASRSETEVKSMRLTQGLHTTANTEYTHQYYDGSDVAPIIYDGDNMKRPSNLPWRNPPNPMPRQVPGKPAVGSIPNNNNSTAAMNQQRQANNSIISEFALSTKSSSPVRSNSVGKIGRHHVNPVDVDTSRGNIASPSQSRTPAQTSRSNSVGKIGVRRVSIDQSMNLKDVDVTTESTPTTMREALRRSSMRLQIGNNQQFDASRTFQGLSDSSNRDPKDPVKWMAPQLARISRADKVGRRNERAINEIIDRVGLPNEMNKSSKYWEGRIERDQSIKKAVQRDTIKESSKIVQFSHSRPKGQSNDMEISPPPPPPPLPAEVRTSPVRLSYTEHASNDRADQHIGRASISSYPPDGGLSDEMSERISKLKAEAQYRMQMLRNGTSQAIGDLGLSYDLSNQRTFDPRLHSAASPIIDDYSVMDMSETTQPIYPRINQQESLSNRFISSSPPPPPPPPLGKGPPSQDFHVASPHLTENTGHGRPLTVSTQAEPDLQEAPKSLSSLFGAMLENGNQLPLGRSMNAPININGFQVASAIEDLMARKQKSLKLLEAATGRSLS